MRSRQQTPEMAWTARRLPQFGAFTGATRGRHARASEVRRLQIFACMKRHSKPRGRRQRAPSEEDTSKPSSTARTTLDLDLSVALERLAARAAEPDGQSRR